ncbi:MAG: C40 family peptidase [Pseudomonadota bacterium]
MPQKNHFYATSILGIAMLFHSGLSFAGDLSSQGASPSGASQAISHPAVAVAEQMLGKPYRYGGASPERGFDCSGLIYYSYRRAGITLPRTSETLYRNAFKVSPENLKQGDLLFFRIEGKVSHVGIYIGGDTFLHAPSSGKVVSYGSLDNPYWREHLLSAGRVF